MSKFKVGDKVIILCYYSDLATERKYKIEDITNSEVRKAIEDGIPQTINSLRVTSTMTTYDIKFGTHTENFFEQELMSAIIDNWQQEFTE